MIIERELLSVLDYKYVIEDFTEMQNNEYTRKKRF